VPRRRAKSSKIRLLLAQPRTFRSRTPRYQSPPPTALPAPRALNFSTVKISPRCAGGGGAGIMSARWMIWTNDDKP
jgi:hypothetical protein